MESVWWVFKQLYDKKAVYRGYKVMPYSTALTTPLSNNEAQVISPPASGACVGFCSLDRRLGKLQNCTRPCSHCDFPTSGGFDDVFVGVDNDTLDSTVSHRTCRECQFRIRQNI